MVKEINQTSHVEWTKHPELLIEIDALRKNNLSFPKIADTFKEKYNLDIHGDTVRSAYKRHKEMIKRNLRKEVVRSAGDNKGIVQVSDQFLEQLLNLPEGVHIQHVEYDHIRGITSFLLKDDTGAILPLTDEAATPMYVALEDITK